MSSPGTEDPASKRRKVRKGTQSCWQCRRRKVRCIFTVASGDACDNCRRRRTACVSQDLPDEPTVPAGGSPVEARLGRVERLLERLANTAVLPARDLSEDYSALLDPESPTPGRTLGRDAAHLTPAASDAESYPYSGRGDRDARVQALGRPQGGPRARVTSLKHGLDELLVSQPEPAAYSFPAPGSRAAEKYEELSRALRAAWPSQREIDQICALPVGILAFADRGLCGPDPASMDQPMPSPQETLRLPPRGSHPVLIARKLLGLAVHLQGVPREALAALPDRGASYRDMRDRVVDTAARLVTTDEDLIGSVEGIECIMLESMYHNYSGNLHRAWMATRRAVTVAQLLGAHRGRDSPSRKILEPQTAAFLDLDQVCFRIVETDCYLSLMLGLPRSSLEARPATPEALAGATPLERMQRIHCAVTVRLLQRSEGDLVEMHDIDAQLRAAAAEMPPTWWLTPDLFALKEAGGGRGGGFRPEFIVETMRLMDQFNHYHLLIRLNLPYMLRVAPDGRRRRTNARDAAVAAAREALARYIAFRTANPAHYYCRGTDFLAFVASTVLCLAHIDAGGRQDPAAAASAASAFSALTHSRPTDRGMMERTLDIIEAMARGGEDAVATRIARLLRPLLAIEASAAAGAAYSTHATRNRDRARDAPGQVTDGGAGLHVHIPYFGTINFERRAEAAAPPGRAAADGQGGAPEAALPGASQPPPTPQQHPPYRGDAAPGLGGGAELDDAALQQLLASTADYAGAEGDWDLQGVDVALFDSLFRGMEPPDAAEEEVWAQWAAGDA